MELLVFSDHDFAARAASLGLDGVMVDLEKADKHRRQRGADTSISTKTVLDVGHARAVTDLPLICRIDGLPGEGEWQIDQVLARGVDEILIPMVTHPSSVERVLARVDGRAAVGIMVETEEAVANAAELAALPLSRVYVGLNDLWIARRSRHRFSAFTDGTVDRLAESFGSIPFGVAGLTHPELGSPLPCLHLLNELVRLGCDFTFLRRSFYSAVEERPAPEVVGAIRAALARAQVRDPSGVDKDRQAAWRAIDQLAPEPVGVTP